MKYPTRRDQREKIRTNDDPEVAKELGRDSEGFRADWMDIRDEVMFQALHAKFNQHQDLKEQLLATGDAQIVEHTEDDKYWGDGGDGGTDEIG